MAFTLWFLMMIRTRLFADTDREALRVVYLESRRHAFDWIDASLIEHGDFDRDTEGERIWVATKKSHPIGFISAWVQGNFVHNLFVHPSMFGKGVGAALLKTCLENLGRPAVLKCVSRNTKAAEFYLSRDWKVASEGEGPDGKYFLMHSEGET
jgi:GNAT superfamily N-acetyltransferase